MRWLLKLTILLLERQLPTRREKLSKEQEDGLLAQLWQNEAFRNYIADRNSKLVYTLAGGEGMKPEPRDDYLMHTGQRVENLLLGTKAKLSYERTIERKKAK